MSIHIDLRHNVYNTAGEVQEEIKLPKDQVVNHKVDIIGFFITMNQATGYCMMGCLRSW